MLPRSDPLLSTHSFSPVLTPFRRRCGMRRRGGRRRRSGRRSARAHASPAHSRSCSTRGLAPCSGGGATGTQSGLLPSRQPWASAWQFPFHLCRGFCFVAFPFRSVEVGWWCWWVAPMGLKWGTPSPEVKHRQESSGAIPWSGCCCLWGCRVWGTRPWWGPGISPHRSTPHAERASSDMGGLGSASHQTAS